MDTSIFSVNVHTEVQVLGVEALDPDWVQI